MNIYDIQVKTIDGKEESLSNYKGKTLLIVNTASKCGYTNQYDGLEALYSKYKDKGFVVMGFPSNDFGAQEPGSDEEIQDFCETRFKVDFPMFTKAPVKGPSKQPLFSYLTQHGSKDFQGEVQWNFEKFLVSPSGEIVNRFASKVKPEDSELVDAVKSCLSL
jgi:glutathione peroxidase